MPESTLALCQSRLYPLVRDFGFSLSIALTQSESDCLVGAPIHLYYMGGGGVGGQKMCLLFIWVELHHPYYER